jgi:hypothetical protein
VPGSTISGGGGAIAYNQGLNNYYRAFGACMQGRGYAVN